MYNRHQGDFVVRGKYAFPNNEMDWRIRHRDFQYEGSTRAGRDDRPYSRYQFSPGEFYNSIQREGRAYDLAANYRRHDAHDRRREQMQQRRALSDFRSRIRRSDDAIADDIHVRLTEHPALDATEILVEIENGEVILSGFVDSRMSKRLAEDICESVRGVRQTENRLRIQPPLGNGLSVGG